MGIVNSGSCVQGTNFVNSIHMNQFTENDLAGKWCRYCACETEEVTGKEVYPDKPHLHEKLFFRCIKDHDHYVGRYEGSGRSLGIIADAHLRKLKMEGHANFDPLWKGDSSVFKTRQEAYQWLSGLMELPKERTHFGMFNEEMCIKAIAFCRQCLNQRQ